MTSSITSRRCTIGATAVGALLLALAPMGAAQATTTASVAPVAAKHFSTGKMGHGKTPAVFKSKGALVTADDTGCEVASLTPASITIGKSEVVKDFAVATEGTGCVGNVTWLVIWNDETGDSFLDNNFNEIEWSPKDFANSDAGTYAFEVQLTNGDGSLSTKDVNIPVRRATTFGTTVNATPEPVKKGKTLTIKGTLTRVSWGSKPAYAGYAKEKVQLQFEAKGTSTYTTVKTVTSGTSGKVSTTVKASKSGAWRMVFAGNSVSGKTTSAADSVTVS